MRIVVNVIAFYAAWFAAAFLAATGHGGFALSATLAAVVVHMAMEPLKRRGRELRLIAAAVALGLLVEFLLLAVGATRFPATPSLPGLPPWWMLGLWAAFATTLNVSLGWLKRRPVLSALLGAVGGAGSYYAGMRIGALELGEPLAFGLAAVAVVWAIAFPLLTLIARRIG